MSIASENVLAVDGLGKKYYLGSHATYSTLRDTFADCARALAGRRPAADAADVLWALRDCSFSVKQGEIVGIVGRNGSGKSTLLKILARIIDPTEGGAVIRGRIAALLEVGTGMHPELSGKENIFLSGSILGLSRGEIADSFDEIVKFAEMARFMETPVKRYSSGMRVRLAFSVSVFLKPEILLIDEVLAVGDAAFQKKCLEKMNEIGRSGRTILFVSHNSDAVRDFCTRAIWLRDGQKVMDAPARETVAAYLEYMDHPKS